MGDAGRTVAWAAQLQHAHGRLREALDLARDALDRGEAPAAVRELPLHCLGFCAALSGHHRAEDRVLFPEVERVRPHLAEALRRLREDHAQLEHLLGAFQHAVDRGEPPDALLRHLDGVEAVMESHFGVEERQLLAVLADLDLDADVAAVLGPLA